MTDAEARKMIAAILTVSVLAPRPTVTVAEAVDIYLQTIEVLKIKDAPITV